MTRFDLDLSVRRRGFSLAVDLSVDAGVLGILGPSGSGKSTLLEALVGSVRPESGRIAIDGEVLVDVSARRHTAVHRRGLALVPQDPLLFPHRDVRRNLSFAPGARSRLRSDLGREVLDVLGLAGLLDRSPAQLSGGERQRVALGRALLANPRALLLDEPLASLDRDRARAILALLIDVHARLGTPLVYVSHQPHEHLALADACLSLEAGRVVASGTPLEVLRGHGERGRSALADVDNLLHLTVLGHAAEAGLTWLDLGGPAPAPRLAIPVADVAVGARLRVGVLAEDVMLARERPAAVSARNVLDARIVSLDPVGDEVLCGLLVGATPLAVRLTPGAVRDLGLEPGGPVVALVKSTACHRLRG